MAKEERRKKIIARGTDRMALITGRINTLNPDPISKSSSFSVPRQDHQPPQHARSSSEPLAANDEAFFQYDHRHYGGDDAPDMIMKHNVEEVSKGNDSRSRVLDMQKLDEPRKVATSSSDNTYIPEKQCSHVLGSITAEEVTISIVSSKDIRAICSVVLGILVVLSHVNLPQNVVKPKSLIAYRPLYVMLLTDVLIVAARLAPHARMRKEYKQLKIEDNDNDFGAAVKCLELGLVLHRIFRALFIDCSLYLVVVIFGLSLV